MIKSSDFIVGYIIDRLLEPSTWRGIILLVGGFGVQISPDATESIVSCCVTLLGSLEILRRER